MFIKEIIYQHRRDFKAIYECEHCGQTEIMWGYDDSNFHENVIPNYKCDKCGKNWWDDYIARNPKYPPHVVI